MSKLNQYVVFALDDQAYCLHLSCVERVIHVVETAVLPKAPPIVTGIINLNGEVIPVVDIRKRFRLPARDMNLSDRLIIARTPKRMVAIPVDTVTGVIESPEDKTVAADKILPGSGYIAGVIKLPDGMVLIHDLDTFLSLEEDKALDSAITDIRGQA